MPPNLQNSKSHEKKFEEIPQELDEIGRKIVHAAFLVHKSLGPGLLEKVYEILMLLILDKESNDLQNNTDFHLV